MPCSLHSHSGQFCKHAKGTLEEVVLEAIRQGFEVFGLTEHVPRYRVEDLYPEEQTLTPSDLAATFDAFLLEAHRLRALYADRITLLVGLETEYISALDLDRLTELLRKYEGQIQYIVGSVHHVNGVPIDFDKETYERAVSSFSSSPDDGVPDEAALSISHTPEHRQLGRFLCAYFDAQHTLLTRFRPEVVAHIDLCRLYTPVLAFSSYPRALEKLRRNVEYAVGYGALFECNAAALRKGWESAYPGEDVVAIIEGCNGRFTLSDDSHGPSYVGLNYARMGAYLRRVGINELWVLEVCEELNMGGRKSRTRRVEGRWWEEEFWRSRLIGEDERKGA